MSGSLFERYSRLLQAYVSHPAEEHLAAASEMGRELVLEGVPPEEMAEVQQEALEQLLQASPQLSLREIALPMSALQSEMLMAYGLVFREQLAERERVEQQIRQSLREKELLLAEIHHRVKNNLQIMSSLFSLQTRFTQDEQSLRILKDSQSRIRSMALIHEKLYHGTDFEHIDFADYLRSLTGFLHHLYDTPNAVIRLEIAPVSLTMDTAIPCGILVTELVSNALKHAFPDGRKGLITVSFVLEAGQAVLTVADNGVGLAKKPDFKKAKSLGWHLIKTLTGQLKGKLEVDSDQGTRVRIVYPV